MSKPADTARDGSSDEYTTLRTRTRAVLTNVRECSAGE